MHSTASSDDEALDLPEEEAIFGDDGRAATWQLLVVDDDPEVHLITRLALERHPVEGRRVEVLSAYSAREARSKLPKHPEIALILLDVVMETDVAGLEFAHYVRRELGNTEVRIVLRTGQCGPTPTGPIPAHDVIDDYLSKTELTYERLLAVVSSALRNYRRLSECLRRCDALMGELRGLRSAAEPATPTMLPPAVLVTDDAGVIRDANAAALDLLGGSYEALLGTSAWDHLDQTSPARDGQGSMTGSVHPGLQGEFALRHPARRDRRVVAEGQRLCSGLCLQVLREHRGALE